MFKSLLIPKHFSSVNPECCAGKLTQKCAVVTDQNKGRACRLQLAFQPADCFNIKVVCRLIEQHQLRRFRHQLGQGRAPFLSAAGGLNRTVRVKLEALTSPLNSVKLTWLKPT